MSDLNAIEKRKLERALGMAGGYVLNFSSRTFEEFFLDSIGLNIYDEKYNRGSGSKANRLRAFWEQESNDLVGKALGILFEEWKEFSGIGAPPEPPEECLKIVHRLKESAPVPNIGAGMPDKFEATPQQRSLDDVDATHLKIVTAGKEAISKWRSEHPDERFHLRRAKFVEKDLNAVDLHDANLEWADFRWCDLVDADLSGTNLRSADFHKADMRRSSLVGADLTGTNLEDADLTDANLECARLRNTKLRNTKLNGARGLETCEHEGPSIIDEDTLSNNLELPSAFLRGCKGSALVDSSASRAGGKPRSRPKVFICHSKQDTARAEELYDELLGAGADPWVDKKKLVLGDAWELEIKKAVAEADAFVVCLRPGFDEIGFRQKEVRWAVEAVELRPPGRGFIIPFIVEPCPLPDWCKSLHAGADLSRPTTIEDLMRAVEKHCLWTRHA